MVIKDKKLKQNMMLDFALSHTREHEVRSQRISGYLLISKPISYKKEGKKALGKIIIF
jgi:hypothetical protein